MAMLQLALSLLAAPAGAPPADTVPLYDNLGNHHHRITTRDPQVQAYFDQGLRLVYAFNHGEAIRAFAHAASLEPECAMCWWGVALAHGPHVNAGMDSASGVKAYEAVQRALALAPRASARERAYIHALVRRYAAVPPADRARLDSAYARAIGRVARQYPRDLDAATLYAEAKMNLRPWNYWRPDGRPHPGTGEIVALLEGVLRRNPDHPGACHYYIHAVEAVYPEKAVPCAERLAALMPGAGHLVHMPAHIYIRVGRYNEAIESNVHAVHADEAYIGEQRPEGLYPAAYYPHNYHFLAFAATMAGRSAQAIEAARALTAKVPADLARQVPPVEPFLTYHLLTLVSFGRWEEVLDAPPPPEDLPFSTAMASYARGVALAATQRWEEADSALAVLRAGAGAVDPRYAAAGWVTPKVVLEIATHCLQGEIAARRGNAEEAVAHFRAAAELEDGMQYIEPPDWYYPVRHSLGAALLDAGSAAEAERVYRRDLRRFPENGWSLYGLAQALRAQGKSREAEAVEGRYRVAWREADVRLARSRF